MGPGVWNTGFLGVFQGQIGPDTGGKVRAVPIFGEGEIAVATLGPAKQGKTVLRSDDIVDEVKIAAAVLNLLRYAAVGTETVYADIAAAALRIILAEQVIVSVQGQKLHRIQVFAYLGFP